MQKRLASTKALAVQNKLKLIVLQANPQNQVSDYIHHERLTEAIHHRELTKSLEILDWYGFEGDLGILAIKQLQNFGRLV